MKVTGKKGQRENQKLYLFPQAFFFLIFFPTEQEERQRGREAAVAYEWIAFASALVWSTLDVLWLQKQPLDGHWCVCELWCVCFGLRKVKKEEVTKETGVERRWFKSRRCSHLKRSQTNQPPTVYVALCVGPTIWLLHLFDED